MSKIWGIGIYDVFGRWERYWNCWGMFKFIREWSYLYENDVKFVE